MYSQQKIEDAVLALLGACKFDNGRVWKRLYSVVMESLAKQGLITDLHGKFESVCLNVEDLARAKALARQPFSI